MKKKENRECTQPRKNDSIPYRVTPVMEAKTYSDRLEKEFEEELAAIVLAETFPDRLDYSKENKEEN